MTEQSPPKSRPKLPAGLAAQGRKLWRDVVARYDLRADELQVLEQACRVRDTLDRLDAALMDAPLTVPGSMGQLREHPLVSEARQQRAALARLLNQLALPDLEAGAPSRAQQRSAWGRDAARSRWAQSRLGAS